MFSSRCSVVSGLTFKSLITRKIQSNGGKEGVSSKKRKESARSIPQCPLQSAPSARIHLLGIVSLPHLEASPGFFF